MHMGDRCESLGQGRLRFCYECAEYLCKRLKVLDKRYRTKFHMSMIDNLNFIQENGLAAFLAKEERKWSCPECSGTICCHNGLCLSCNLGKLLQNKKYRWNDEP